MAGMSSSRLHGLGGEHPRLRAQVAVLGAAAGLDRDDPFDLDIGTAPHPDPMRELEELGDLRVGMDQHLEDLCLVESSPSSSTCVPAVARTSVTGGTSRRGSCLRRKSAASKRPPNAGPSPARRQQELQRIQLTRTTRHGPVERASGEHLQVADVAAARWIRLRRPAADDEAGEFQPTMRDGFECRRGRVQRAEAGSVTTTSCAPTS